MLAGPVFLFVLVIIVLAGCRRDPDSCLLLQNSWLYADFFLVDSLFENLVDVSSEIWWVLTRNLVNVRSEIWWMLILSGPRTSKFTTFRTKTIFYCMLLPPNIIFWGKLYQLGSLRTQKTSLAQSKLNNLKKSFELNFWLYFGHFLDFSLSKFEKN